MTTWSFGGTALASFGRVTLIDDSMDVSDRRGRNKVVPFRHGSRFVEKYYEERKLTFGIAIKSSSHLAQEATIDTLKKLIGVRTPQVLSQTREDTSVRTGLATVDKNFQFKSESGTFCRVVLEFTMPFPFFRLSTAIADNTTTINADPTAMVVTNPGTVEESDATIILTGPLKDTVITNSTNGTSLSYAGTIASPRVVTISKAASGEYVATDDLSANKIGQISHAGSASMLVFDPGVNNLSIADDTHTTGTVKITFNPPFS